MCLLCELSVVLGQDIADMNKSLVLDPVVADVQITEGSVVLEQDWQVAGTISRQGIATHIINSYQKAR